MADAYVSEATKQNIGERYLGGADLTDVAEAVGLDTRHVAEVLTELGIPERVETNERERRERRERLDAEAATLYRGGMSIRAIVRAQGRSYGTVHRALSDRTTMRPRGAPSSHRPAPPATGPTGAL